MGTRKSSYKHAKETVEFDVMEQVDGFKNLKLPNRHFYGHNEFVTVFQHYLLEVVTKGNLTKDELKLIIYFLAKVGEYNSLNTDTPTIAADLGIQRQNAVKALKGLVLRNIVIRKDGNRYEHAPLPLNIKLNFDSLNYNFAYNGKVKEHKKLMHQHPDVQKKLS